MGRKNCWEVLKCGWQPGGENAEKHGACPAALPGEYDGVNGGERSGRFCWVVARTFCFGESQETLTKKLIDCINCEFFKQVSEDEGRNFVLTTENAKDKSRREV